MSTTKRAVKATTVKSVPVTVEVEATKKATPYELLDGVLTLIDRQVNIDPEKVKFGKAVPLVGGGSVYINRSNADVRLTTGAVQALAKSIKGSAIRGPQGQYLRITF